MKYVYRVVCNKQNISLLIFSLLFTTASFCQDQNITGTVTDSAGSALQGVSVTAKGTSFITQTGADGKFTIRAAKGKVLIFSIIGFTPKEITVGSGNVVNVALLQASRALDEVVVVGYGSQSKRNLATSTARVSASEIKNAVISTVDQALQGRATGVQVVQTSGEPGSATVVRIRGNNSLSGNNEPLYVIDGFPMPPYREASANFYGSYSQNGLYGINPNDIESMEVLKDASATAIYGSRGANGVVLITTKAGKRGEGRVELVNKTSFGNVTNPVKMMTGKQYAEIVNETYTLKGNPEPFGNIDTINTSTDWFNAITRPSLREDISFSVSGGSPKSSYYVSGNYLLDKGVLLSSDNKRGSLRANLNNDVTNWYTIKAQLSLVRQTSNRAITNSHGWPSEGGSFLDALRAAPTTELNYLGFNGAGIPGYSGGNWFANPYNELTNKTDVSKNDYTVVNVENAFRFTKSLQLVVSLGSNQNLTRRQVFYPASTAVGHVVNGNGSNTMANTYSYNVNAYFLYDKTFKESHNLNLTLGTEYNTQTLELLNTATSGYDIPLFGINNIGSAQRQSTGSYKEDRSIQSAFFRGNYSYKGKYVLNTSVRLDGASPFAENKKHGLFPAVALGWNFSEEDFMKNVTFITNSKLRASYGETGSQAINPYSSLSRYGNAFYQLGIPGTVVTSLYPTSLGNPNLSWERTKQFNAGLDFSTISNRLTVSFDYYIKTTDDLLQPRTLPSQSGFGGITDNYGSMQNKGVELSLQADIIRQKDLRLSTRFNISRNINTLLNLGSKTTSDYVGIGGNLLGGVSGILTPGQEVGQFYGYRVTGLIQESDFKDSAPTYAYPGSLTDQVPGGWKYQDKDGNKVIDADDRQILGNSSPDFTYGWNTDLLWKNFGINLFFTGSQGNDILNLTSFYLNNGLVNYSDIVFNQTADWYKNRWTPSNPTNNPRYPGTQKNIAVGDINSTMVEDGSFFRLKTATISYTLPSFKVFNNPRLFVTGTNLFTITKYTGFDPEVSSFSQSLLQQGIDYGAYPGQRTYTIGVSCNF